MKTYFSPQLFLLFKNNNDDNTEDVLYCKKIVLNSFVFVVVKMLY